MPTTRYRGDRRCCQSGVAIAETVAQEKLGILNGIEATFRSRQYQTESNIDLAFVDKRSLLVKGWSVGDDPWGSDHYPITIEFKKTTENRISNCNKKRLYNRTTDWAKFRQTLQDKLEDTISVTQSRDIDTQVNYTTLVAIIVDAIQNSIPQIHRKTGCEVTTKPSPAPWWTEECDRLIRTRKGAFLRTKEYFPYENFIKYKRIEAKTKYRLREIKREQFEEFTQKFTKYTNPTYIWRKIKAFNNGLNYSEKKFAYNQARVENSKTTLANLCPN